MVVRPWLVPALWFCCTAVGAQTPQPAAAPAGATGTARQSPAQQRAAADLQAAARKLLANPHAFTVVCDHRAAREQPEATAVSTFRGACRDATSFFVSEDCTSFRHGDRELVRKGNGAWQLPQGDTADCPLWPRDLAKHLAAATIVSVAPASHADRPAVRLHVTWQGNAAAPLLADASVPDTRAQGVLERVPALRERLGDELTVVDATLALDPATKTLYAATVRLALLSEREHPADAEPPRAPEGLPPLAHPSLFEVHFAIAIQPATGLPWPALDPATRERLGLPDK